MEAAWEAPLVLSTEEEFPSLPGQSVSESVSDAQSVPDDDAVSVGTAVSVAVSARSEASEAATVLLELEAWKERALAAEAALAKDTAAPAELTREQKRQQRRREKSRAKRSAAASSEA